MSQHLQWSTQRRSRFKLLPSCFSFKIADWKELVFQEKRTECGTEELTLISCLWGNSTHRESSAKRRRETYLCNSIELFKNITAISTRYIETTYRTDQILNPKHFWSGKIPPPITANLFFFLIKESSHPPLIRGVLAINQGAPAGWSSPIQPKRFSETLGQFWSASCSLVV